MVQTILRSGDSAEPKPQPAQTGRGHGVPRPFFGLIESNIVEEPVAFPFEGSVSRPNAIAAWNWVLRDFSTGILDVDAITTGTMSIDQFEDRLPELLARIRDVYDRMERGELNQQRLVVQSGSEETFLRAPIVFNALRHRTLLEKAAAFGRAANGITDDAAMATALQAMPINDPSLFALLMHAAVGQMGSPSRFVAAAVRNAGSSEEGAVVRAGYAPVVEAIFAHAQNQLHVIRSIGAFADMDRLCRALERYHKLMRALTGYIEFNRVSTWSNIVSTLTKMISERVDPILRNVPADINLSLRRGREGLDRVDEDQLFAALNGMYLLATVRDCRDSLAVNARLEEVWSQTGQSLELHLTRNLDILREHPRDANTLRRLDAGIKMAEVRFNPEYAEVLKRSMDTATRRAHPTV